MTNVKLSWRQEMPAFLHFLDDALDYPVRLHEELLGFHIYLVDFSAWKLRFSDRSPVIWVRSHDLSALPERELAQSLAELIRLRNLAERNPILLVDGAGAGLRAALQRTLLPALVLDQADQDAVRESRRPTGELLDRLSQQMALSLLTPYETSKPVSGSRFFGRDLELRRILQGSTSNFAIMGIRRIGKTSLLREIERRLRAAAQESGDERAQDRIIVMDCSAIASPNDFVREIVRKLHPPELARLDNRQFPIFFPNFLERMARRFGGRLIFLLDEFDSLLAWHYTDGALLHGLRASSNLGHCRYIIAGFRDLMRAGNNLDSPLYNFAKDIRLRELSREQASDMIIGPLEKLRVHFEQRSEIVNRIYDETAGQPNLIQFYCQALVERLDQEDSRVLTPAYLTDVYTNEDFRTFVLGTFMDNTTHLEKVIVFAVMAEYGGERAFDLEAIDAALARRAVNTRVLDIEQACRNLEMAGTFAASGREYRFATPVFPHVLTEKYDPDFLLRKLRREGL
ncbi:AAA family ATPase [Candidatus Amarolinea aalborgensis]|uniref:AAA family ATPase n=1 Tax=Candidatus Amarolinea aalborgensis TaxID=2249329 RepID=UPI003BF99D32